MNQVSSEIDLVTRLRYPLASIGAKRIVASIPDSEDQLRGQVEFRELTVTGHLDCQIDYHSPTDKESPVQMGRVLTKKWKGLIYSDQQGRVYWQCGSLPDKDGNDGYVFDYGNVIFHNASSVWELVDGKPTHLHCEVQGISYYMNDAVFKMQAMAAFPHVWHDTPKALWHYSHNLPLYIDEPVHDYSQYTSEMKSGMDLGKLIIPDAANLVVSGVLTLRLPGYDED